MSDPHHESLFEVEGLGRSFLVGALIGFASTFMLALCLTVAVGVDLGTSAAVAGFTAAWAGFGLGGMFGAIWRTHHLH